MNVNANPFDRELSRKGLVFQMANKLVDSIQMEVRSTQPCRKEFDFTVPADVVKGETANTLREIAAQVSLPGFRPGKAPVGLIRSKFENELKDELQRKLIYAAFELAGKDEANDIVTCGVEGKPELKFDEEFKFTIGADVAPEFEVGDYKSVKVEIPVDAVTDEQVEERVKFYRSAYGNYTEVEGPAQAEDMLKVNYKSDFAAPEDASAAVKRQLEAENTFLWLSEPETIPGCIAALTGAKKDGEYTFEAAYPADYREAALAGKTIKYTVKVLGIQRRNELNDEQLAEKARVKSIEEFRDMLRKAMEQENAAKNHNEVLDAVYKKLSDMAGDFELPPNVLQAEIQKELQKIARDTVKSEEDAEKFKKEIDAHRAEAEKAARAALRKTFLLRKIARLEKITLDQKEVDAQLRNMSRYYGYKEKEFRDMLEKNGGMDDLQLDLINAKVLNQLAEAAVK